MIKVTISKNNVVTNSAEFSTLAEAEAWVASQEQDCAFGKPERWLFEHQFSDESVEAALESRQPVNSLEIQYKFPAEYSVSFQDISVELLTKEESDDALKFLNETDWKVLRHIRQKALGEPLSLTEEQYLDLEAERSLAAAKVIR